MLFSVSLMCDMDVIKGIYLGFYSFWNIKEVGIGVVDNLIY